ncbi:hypothetical protein L6252_00285 [Candidatus Parcubacteria bacterium]|nr:hypothetical protein [Candidatus Parcubacteria bacterium]
MLRTKLQKTFQKGKESFLKLFVLCRYAPKKYTLPILGIIVFAGLCLPQYYAKAFSWTGILTGGISGLVKAIETALLVQLVASLITEIGVWLLVQGWQLLGSISGTTNIGGFALTNPTNNPIIEIGWTFIRDFTNMFFILGLAYIGLATALDIGGQFKVRKTFFTLMVIALLVNFSPVICGAIVDASQILKNVLIIGNNTGQIIYDAIDSAREKYLSQCSSIVDLQCWLSWVGINIFSYLSATIIWGIAITFLLRNIIIWLLVIISPLAFLAKVFKETEKWFKEWWSALLQWSFVGVTLSFFLYLSSHLGNVFFQKENSLQIIAASTSKSDQLIVNLAPLLIMDVFLIVGYTAAMRAMPKMAKSIIGLAYGAVLGSALGMARGFGNKLKTQGMAAVKATSGKAKNFALNTNAGLLSKEGLGAYKASRAAGQGRLKSFGAMREGGMQKREDFKGTIAKVKEMAGGKLRPLDDLGPEEVRKEALGSASTPEQLKRKAQAIKKLVDNDDFDFEFNTPQEKQQIENMINFMHKNSPQTSISKLSKSRPELTHLVDAKDYQKEITKLGGPGNEARAKFNLVRGKTRKMGVSEIINIPIEKYGAASNELVAVFAGLTPGKMKKYGEEARPERVAVLKRIATTGTTENTALTTKFPATSPDRPLIDQTIVAINGDVNFV